MQKWNSRKEVQNAHERFTTKLFLEHFNRWHRSHFEIVEMPDPPDAIIRSGKTVRWVEVVTVYWNKAWARDQNSYVTEGE